MSTQDRRSFAHPALAAVVNALLDPVVLTDANGIVTFANSVAIERAGAGKYLGVAIVEQAARREILTPDGQPLSPDEHPVSRVLARRTALTGTRVILQPAGGRASTYRINTVPLWDGDRLVGTASVFHDIAHALALETDLADHAARLEAIVNLVSDAVFVMDGDARLLFHNAVGERLLGLATDVSLADRASRLDLRDADGHPVPQERFPSRRALGGETVAGETFLLTDPEGRTRHVVTSAHPLRRPDGAVYAALVTMKDVTDEIRAREELESARESAEEASHLKDQFIAALSHELRTPLQPILGWTEVLQRHGTLDPVMTQALDAIRRNVRQQVRLVDDLLDLSRIVHGKLALRFEVFDLREQVRLATDAYEDAAALKGIRLTVSLPEEPVTTWGDGTRIHQIATNLISNAIKFTAAGGHVNVQLIANDVDALLEVEDTGEGIAPEELAVIFEAFRQGSAARRRGGLGIGLDLVRRLVELHDGAVDAYSEGRGYGARFSVRLPRRLPHAAQPREVAMRARRLEQRQILVIEDNADTRDVMKFMLEAEGARVETADTGERGLEIAARSRPNVILCDIGLPDMDGLDVARKLRRTQHAPDSRLIALTGYGQPEDVKNALEAGFEAHLTKPINLDQLMTLLVSDAPATIPGAVDSGGPPQVE